MPIMTCTAQIDEAVRAHIQGKTDQAESLYKSVLTSVPNHPQASQFLGVLLFQAGRRAEGLDWMERAVRTNPGDPEGWSNLGNAYRVMGRGPEAVQALNRALAISPTFAPAYCTLSACLREAGTLSKAIEAARNAVRLRPEMAQAHCNLGLALLDAGEIPNAIAAFQQAIYVSPNFLEARQSLLFAMHYGDQFTAKDILAQARKFGSTQPSEAWPVTGELKTVAFLSGDFRNHPVATFLEPLLAHMDSRKFRVVLLSNTPTRDEVTERLAAHSFEFIEVHEMSPVQLQTACKALDVDVIVDLAGHTASNRMDALAIRLAPVQVSWLGYSGTTGLPTMDWILADSELIPTGATEYTERVARLTGSAFCFDQTRFEAPLAPPPCITNGYVTFGSFNNHSKISPSAVAAWAEILNQVPGSRIIVKSRHLGEEAMADRVRAMFAQRGIDLARVTVTGWTVGRNPLEDYNQVDVALDTFPYSGATTTVDALSMGVPVVTYSGDRYAGRMSRSILAAIGRIEWVTEDQDSYTAQAVKLAERPEKLAQIRSSLRTEIAESPLTDPKLFARNFQETMLHIWSQSQKSRQIY